jgi:hypothetical protein
LLLIGITYSLEMKKISLASTAVLGSVLAAKRYQNHNKEIRHKMKELAKPYPRTLNEDLLIDVANTAPKGKKTCVIIGGGVAGISSVRIICRNYLSSFISFYTCYIRVNVGIRAL